MKRVFDFLAALTGLIMMSPVLLITMILVKRDGGPAFFFQDRLGKGTRVFKVIKLRSMVVNAEAMLDAKGRPTGKRITRVGEFLRKSSIDELPQLINILKGDMSLVGPRPILPRMLLHMTDNECERFLVRPGVTGLAQVRGRNFIRWSRRFRYDRIYVRKQSLLFDLRILWLTIKVVVQGSGIAAEVNPDQVDDVTVRPNVREPVQ